MVLAAPDSGADRTVDGITGLPRWIIARMSWLSFERDGS